MIIGERLRLLREVKDLSQGDIEQRTGPIKRCYISRVENGHTIPAIETFEKMARALEVPIYQLFHDGEEPPKPLTFPKPEQGCGVIPARRLHISANSAGALQAWTSEIESCC